MNTIWSPTKSLTLHFAERSNSQCFAQNVMADLYGRPFLVLLIRHLYLTAK